MRKDTRNELFGAIFQLAHLEGMEAAKKVVPVPMVVQQHANMADDNSPVEKQWFVEGGVCGFGWVSVKPGNSPFANWLKANGKGRPDSYAGGVCVNTPMELGQSMARNEAYAYAFAAVLQSKGITAYGQSRID